MKGFIALTTVLVISIIVLSVGLGLILRSTGEAQMGLQKNLSSQAYYLANLCAEQALTELKDSLFYTGPETIFVGSDSCTVTVAGTAGSNYNRTVEAVGDAQGRIKKITVVIDQVSPIMDISSWQEVAE